MKLADRLGIFLSGLCLVHCFLLPFIFLVYPALVVHVHSHDESNIFSFHGILFGLVVIASLSAFIPGYKIHKHVITLVTSLLGISILLFSAFFCHDLFGHQYEGLTSILGSLVLISAHIMNHKLCKNADHDCSSHGCGNEIKKTLRED